MIEYKKANSRETKIITLSSGEKIGGGNFLVMAGPCSVENEDQLMKVAIKVKAAGAQVLRGGAFKARTKSHSFQGLGKAGIDLLMKAKQVTGLPIVTEIQDIRHLPLYEDVDIIQVGTRNMFNYELLKELGKIRKPVLLKRGMAATVEEFLCAAQYIRDGGNDQIILCERGIRTFEPSTRNTLDISAVPEIQRRSDYPVIVDPSHGTGRQCLVEPMAMAAAAAGADGLMIEVHNDPSRAFSDGAQSLTPEDFEHLMQNVGTIRKAWELCDNHSKL